MVFDFTVFSGSSYALASLAAGVAIGVIYGFFRALRMVLKAKGVLLFLFDLLFCTAAVCIFLLVTFNYSSGEVRGYALVCCGASFFAYDKTLGRFVNTAVIMLIKAVRFILCPLAKALGKLCETVNETVRKVKARRELKRLTVKARSGFGL
ncbi:MAG TPA: spore cortex biosynthesis protein YabQ [Bacillota bacterium]|nr:spore cortex biosynthesis protein YabQ [Bacillota bacterium]